MNSNQQKGRQFRIAMKHIVNRDGHRDHLMCEMQVNREIAAEQLEGKMWMQQISPCKKAKTNHKNLVLKSRQQRRKHRRSNKGQN